MREPVIPLSLVKEMMDQQREFTKMLIEQQNQMHVVQLQALGDQLLQCATLFEKALNPPIATVIPEVPDMVSNLPRMSEEEEDWYYAFQQGDITKAELDKRLKGVMQGAYSE